MIHSEIQSATHDNSSAADARRMVERSRLIGQLHHFHVKTRFGGVFAFIDCKNIQAATTLLPDCAPLIRPTN